MENIVTSSIQDKDNKIYALEKIIETIIDGIILSDANGKILIYNNAMEKLEDKQATDMVGKYLWDAYEYEQQDSSEHRKVFNSGVPILNRYGGRSCSNGVRKYTSYNTYPIIKDDERIGVYSVVKNETKLHTLLAETIELKRRFNSEKIENNSNDYNSNGTTYSFANIVGCSESIRTVIKEAQAIAWLDNNVLIVGDTGTGKEVFAQSIHNYGKRIEEPFIGINCSAIPENLLESILFGNVKGAFTGAINHTGLFREARGGTLFLDELNSMPISMQTKLLRVIQERVVRPVGGNTTYPINCRIISAINEDPHEIIEAGRLREDLFYRISGFNLYIPSLHERTEDILELSNYYIGILNKSMDKNIIGLSEDLKQIMLSYKWPGNVRELQHFIENIMFRAEVEDKYLGEKNIPDYLKERIINLDVRKSISENKSLPKILNNLEKRIILEALDKNKWNITRTARELGIIRQSLIYRIKKLEIERPITV